jgi:hypothetical protein
VPRHTVTVVLDFLLNTFVSLTIYQNAMIVEGLVIPQPRPCKGLREEQIVPKETWLINGTLSILCVIVCISAENGLMG